MELLRIQVHTRAGKGFTRHEIPDYGHCRTGVAVSLPQAAFTRGISGCHAHQTRLYGPGHTARARKRVNPAPLPDRPLRPKRGLSR